MSVQEDTSSNADDLRIKADISMKCIHVGFIHIYVQCSYAVVRRLISYYVSFFLHVYLKY